MEDSQLADLDYAYLTTTGRRSGLPREIEIWFALERGRIYLLAGDGRRAHWVRNLLANPALAIRIGDQSWPGTGQPVSDPAEDARARALLVAKYGPRYSGDLEDWGRTALVMAVDRAGAGQPA